MCCCRVGNGDECWGRLAHCTIPTGVCAAVVGAFIDITERKRAEEAMWESEAKYRDLFETVQEVFYIDRLIYDEQGNVVDWIFEDLNPAGFELLGLKDIDEAKGKRGSEVLGREIASFYLPMIEKARRSSKAVTFQYHSPYVDKEFLTSYIVRGDRLISAQMDITELKRAEEALRLSEQKFAMAFANNPAAIALTRLEDGLFLDVNDTWVALNGYSRDEVIGHFARKMRIWPTAQAASRFVQELREKGCLHGWEQEFYKKSGKAFMAQLSAQILTFRGEKVILSTFVDITEQQAGRGGSARGLREAPGAIRGDSVQNEELQAQSEKLHEAYEALHESEENVPDAFHKHDRGFLPCGDHLRQKR